MSRPLLKLGGGSGDILSDVLHLPGVSEAETVISGAEGRDELRHIRMSLQAPEPFGCFEDTRGGPAQYHLAAPPALDVALTCNPGFPFCLSRMAPFIHPTAAARTKFCLSHNRPDPETVTQPALTCDRLEPLFSGYFSDTGPHLRRFFSGAPSPNRRRLPGRTIDSPSA